MQFTAEPAPLQVLSKHLLDDLVYVKLGPEDEKEPLVKAGGVRGPGGENSRCRGSKAGKRHGEQPRVAESG